MAQTLLILDRYDVEFHARGGMGEVWIGQDTRLGREVAVKIIRLPGGDLDAEYTERFVRESRITARLRHPGVPAVYDTGVHEGRLFLVLERVHGVVLTDVIAERGRLPIGWAAGIGAQISSVLAAAHASSLIHRDLKPSNVMLEPHGGVKVLDFGVAAAQDFSRITRSGQRVGTPGYMAPEQLVAAKGVPQTDLYALGITLHEMLAGKKLFTAATQYSLMTQQVKQPPTPIRELCPEVPAELERLVLDLLNKEPEDRPPSAEVVYQRLLPFVNQLGPLPGHLDPPMATSPARMYGLVLGRVFAAPSGTPTVTSHQRGDRVSNAHE